MRNPVIHFLFWALFLNHPLYAQEAIQIEIDSAPVEVEIQKPATPARTEEAAPAQTAETEQREEEEKEEGKSGKGYGVALGIGALVAGILAAVGGGGGGGGGSSTTQH